MHEPAMRVRQPRKAWSWPPPGRESRRQPTSVVQYVELHEMILRIETGVRGTLGA